MQDGFYYHLDKPGAVPPTKGRSQDSGYDLTLIEKIKTDGEVEYYDTHVRVKPKDKYYFELFPRSSIVKTGYMLANSVGIIDNNYTGTIKVVLIKVDKTKPDLQLPIRLVQIIPKKVYDLKPLEYNFLEEKSERGDAGFGSSGQ